MVLKEQLQSIYETLHDLGTTTDLAFSFGMRQGSDPGPEHMFLTSYNAQFIDLYRATIDTNVATDLSLRRLFCNFLSASLLTVLARAEDVIADQVRGSRKNDMTVAHRYSYNIISTYAR